MGGKQRSECTVPLLFINIYSKVLKIWSWTNMEEIRGF